MTKKDFRLIADVLASTNPFRLRLFRTAEGEWKMVIRSFAAEFGRTFPRFDKVKFYKACGLEE